MHDLELALLYTRGVAHLLTFLILASYREPGAKYRRKVSAAAVALASASGMAAMSILVNRPCARLEHEIPLLLLSAVLLYLVAVARGNVARFFPRKVWSHRP